MFFILIVVLIIFVLLTIYFRSSEPELKSHYFKALAYVLRIVLIVAIVSLILGLVLFGVL